MKVLFSIVILLLASIICGFSQTIMLPNYALKSHETLNIKKIEITSATTVVSLSVENRIAGGTFCADKNIFILKPDGTRIRLISSSGIPVCPDTYKFKTVGEKLDFTITFPPLKAGTEWIDIIEDCSDNCFSFYGVTLDNELNKNINEAFVLAENKEPAKAMVSFIKIVEATDSNNSGIEGLLYVSIIKLAKESGNTVKASEWYNKLASSNAPRLSNYIKYLNDSGIKY